MSERRTLRLLRVFVLGLTFSLLLCARGFAQAWLPPKGEGSFSFSYGNTFVRDHLYTGNVGRDRGHMRTNFLSMGLGYGLTDRLALSAELPYVVSKYYGAFPHVAANGKTIDTGEYHGTFQDYKFNLRYQILRGSFVATPFAEALIPSHDYIYFAHSGAGRHVREYLIGTYFGKILDPVVPGAYVQGRYSYAFPERILGVHHDRSNVDLAAGYFLTPSLDVRAIGSWGYTHGGLVSPDPIANPAGAAAFRQSKYWPHHDQIGRERFVNVGGGVAYVLSGSVDVYATYLATVWGENSHGLKNGINVGFSWGFSPTQVVRRFFPRSQAAAETP